MTLQEAHRTGTERLAAAGIEEASLDAWYLLEYVTGISRAGFLADSGKEMEDTDKENYLKLIKRRAKRIPLQHITGVQEFMGLEFQVDEHVLIPRQDTEILVETTLEEVKKRLCLYQVQRMNYPVSDTVRDNGQSAAKTCVNDGRMIRVLDMCTGSGCILLSMLYYAREEAEKYRVPVEQSVRDLAKGSEIKITGMGIDISPEALRVAKRNGEMLDIEAEWMASDLFAGIEGKFDMILSNPPYIPSAVIETLQPEVREHDPRLALDGKEDGLYFYRRIVEEGRRHLNPGGYLAVEIGSDQGEAVSSYMKACGYTEVAVKKDLAGLDRVVSGMYDIW